MGYAEKLQRLCALKHLDQSGLAEKVGISRSTVSRIVSGAQEPKLGLAWKLAQTLGVSLDFLADDAVEMEPGAHWVCLSEDELTILKLVRRLGTEEAMDRILGVASEPAAGQGKGTARHD